MLAMQDSGCTPSAISPLEQAVKRYEEQVSRLSDVIDKLDIKLACVSSVKTACPTNVKEQPRPQLAPIIQVVDGMTDKIIIYRGRIEAIIERLDI